MAIPAVAMESGEIDEIYLAYTVFKNTVTQVPTLIKMLPFSQEDIETMAANDVPETTSGALMNYEPTEEEALGYIIPMYMNSLIFGALVEAVASENGARMQAMDSATSNAEEMIDTLGLQYNRARQSAITQELTEIVAGIRDRVTNKNLQIMEGVKEPQWQKRRKRKMLVLSLRLSERCLTSVFRMEIFLRFTMPFTYRQKMEIHLS